MGNRFDDVRERALFAALIYAPLAVRSSTLWMAVIGGTCVLMLGYPVAKALALSFLILIARRFNAHWKWIDAGIIALLLAAVLHHSEINLHQVGSQLGDALSSLRAVIPGVAPTAL